MKNKYKTHTFSFLGSILMLHLHSDTFKHSRRSWIGEKEWHKLKQEDPLRSQKKWRGEQNVWMTIKKNGWEVKSELYLETSKASYKIKYLMKIHKMFIFFLFKVNPSFFFSTLFCLLHRRCHYSIIIASPIRILCTSLPLFII